MVPKAIRLSEVQASTLWYLLRKGGMASAPSDCVNSTESALVRKGFLRLEAAAHQNSPGGHMRPRHDYRIVTEAGRTALVDYIKVQRLPA
jgi:hypothetical protein